MSDLVRVSEIESKFDSEWVLVGDPETDESLHVQSGRVIYHSKDRDEVYRKAVELKPKRFAMLYTGTLPKDTAHSMSHAFNPHQGLILVQAEIPGF